MTVVRKAVVRPWFYGYVMGGFMVDKSGVDSGY